MTRNRHPAASVRGKGHLRVVPDLPPVLPVLVPGDDEDPEGDPYDVLEMSLPTETLRMLWDRGLGVQDVLDGRVPGLDPDEIVAKAMEETGSHNGPWTPFE